MHGREELSSECGRALAVSGPHSKRASCNDSHHAFMRTVQSLQGDIQDAMNIISWKSRILKIP
eukprot:1157917-Pelagomonas_calceolata.AAC.9